MDVQLPGPRGKVFSSSNGSPNPSPTITHQRRPGGDAAIKYGHDGGLRRITPAGFRPSEAQALIPIPERVNPTASLATFGGGNPHSGSSDPSAPRGFLRVPISKNAVRLLKSPGLEGLTSTVLIIALLNWTREDSATTVPPRRCVFVGLALPPETVSTPERRVSWSPLPFGKASESDSGTACCSTSQLGEGSRAQHSAGGLFPAPTGSSTIGSGRASGHATDERGSRGLVAAPSPLSANRGRSDAPCWSPVEQWSQLPTREEGNPKLDLN